ncbi:LysR family transcriptional regulator [Albidovulum aquaemixtae]|uniref:LysR family transcriptional regulator n=1 Tax=Albidovulum aquaemixtae TaxID=1542388 RepID=UPI0034D97FC7
MVARHGTVTRAAEELSVSPSAVSQQIKSLEQELGLKLFRRDGRLLTLTLEGEQLFQKSANALGMLRDAREPQVDPDTFLDGAANGGRQRWHRAGIACAGDTGSG